MYFVIKSNFNKIQFWSNVAGASRFKEYDLIDGG